MMTQPKTKQPTTTIEEDLEAARPTAIIRECVVAKTVREHESGEAINRFVNDLGYGADRLVAVLAKRGVRLSSTGVRRHRRQECPCYVIPATRKV